MELQFNGPVKGNNQHQKATTPSKGIQLQPSVAKGRQGIQVQPSTVKSIHQQPSPIKASQGIIHHKLRAATLSKGKPSAVKGNHQQQKSAKGNH
jgi:hypothetical protein